MANFNWLHLTDLHWGLNGQDSLWPNARQAFFDDLEKIHERSGPWNAILFTGDFVQQGRREEFEQLEEKVLGPLWQRLDKLGSGKAQLLAVPGNHDLTRPDAKKPAPALKWLFKPDLFEDIADELFSGSGGEYGQVLSQSFAEYSRWWDRVCTKSSSIPINNGGVLPGDMSASFELDGGLRVGIVGLNTTFLQLAGGNYQGKLAWDLRQFNGVCGGDGAGWVAEHDICLLMTHQGSDWLNPVSQKAYPEINPAGRFAAHLFGHMHVGKAESRRVGGGKDLRRWQGSSLFGMEKFGEPPQVERIHGYSAGRIEAHDGQASMRLWPRIAVFDSNGWRLKPDDGPDAFILQDDWGTAPEMFELRPRAPRPAAAPGGAARIELSFSERQALEAYTRAARRVWDIIDLAGLPEDDRHLAMNKFILRQLYAPLRLTVETTAEENLTEEGAAQMEDRRERKRLAEAGRGEKPEERNKKFSLGQRLQAPETEKKTGKKKAEGAAHGQGPEYIPHIVILGDPGGGKTTLLRWLATAYLLRYIGDPDAALLPDVETLPDKPWLPVLVRCRELDKEKIGQCTLEDILGQTLDKLELPGGQIKPLIALLRGMLARGQALLLVDGLDEITDPTLRAAFCARIETIAQLFPAPLVVTSRLVGYREMRRRLQGGFEHVTLADLAPQDKDDFVRRWCEVTIAEAARRKSEAEKLIGSIHGMDRIERLTGNPMLLTSMAMVQRKVGKLPSKRHKLYWEAVNVLLNWRSDVEDPLDADEALPQLEYLAWEMCNHGAQRLRRDELLALLEDMRREYPNIRPAQAQTPESFLAQLERRTGLLVEMGYEQYNGRPEAVYEFRHLTFQEYLAALALVEGRYPGHERGSTLAERVGPLGSKVTKTESELGDEEFQVSENWREALRLCIACCNDDEVDNALLAILGKQNGRGKVRKTEGRARTALAAACLADEPNVTQTTGQRVLECFARQVGANDGYSSINTAFDRAATELAIGPWLDVLQSALIHEFLTRKPETRGDLGSLFSVVVEHTTRLNTDAKRKRWMAEQVERLASSENALCAAAALAIMGAAYDGSAVIVPGLINSLLSLLERAPSVAHAAAWALCWLTNFGGRHQAVWQLSADEFSRFLPYLSHPDTDPEVRIWLLRIIEQVPSVEAVPLLQSLRGSPREDVRQTAIAGLIMIQDDEIAKKLITRRFSGERYPIDLQQPIDEQRVLGAVEALKMDADEVRRRYEALADEYGLKLAWRAG